ncbi:MAG: hypothetical protein KDI46_03360 [Alphaproteobacteria bacterium]|nr:hypothetical protein [Alphaproteobacteria bacterium]
MVDGDIRRALEGDLDRAARDVYLTMSENIRLTAQEERNIKKVMVEDPVMLKLDVEEMIRHDVELAEEKLGELIDFVKDVGAQENADQLIKEKLHEIIGEMDREIEGDTIKEYAKEYAGDVTLGKTKEVPNAFKTIGDKMREALDRAIERANNAHLLQSEASIQKNPVASVSPTLTPPPFRPA